MIGRNLVRAAVALALAGTAVAAQADVLEFSGAMTGLGVGAPGGGCDPLPFKSTIPANTTSGISNLGDFTYAHTICLGGVNAPANGTFEFFFGNGTIFGTLQGFAIASAIPGIGNPTFTYTILGGTGAFLDASGTLVGTGLTDARSRPTIVSLAFSGDIDAPAVPEPGSWALMLVGFGGMAVAMRRRRTAVLAQIA
jgi:hypothetical protein